MNSFDLVTRKWGHIPYMKEDRGRYIRDFMLERRLFDVLEIGFFHGKSSAYFAAIMEDAGNGHLVTIDLEKSKKREPNIDAVFEAVQLSHRLTPVYAQRSYTWELKKLIEKSPRPQFDLCYFDGGHTWDLTGFGFFLVDMLLKPGGWIIFDDLDWTIQSMIDKDPERREKQFRGYSQDERNTPGVRLVWDLLVPSMGYINKFEQEDYRWGIAQKP